MTLKETLILDDAARARALAWVELTRNGQIERVRATHPDQANRFSWDDKGPPKRFGTPKAKAEIDALLGSLETGHTEDS